MKWSGDSANLPQLERLLNPFFASRNVGLRYNNMLLHQNMTISGGWFNNWWATGKPYAGSSNQFTTRVTALLFSTKKAPATCTPDLPRAGSAPPMEICNFPAKPESNVTSNYLSTGVFPANSATEYGFEGLVNVGPVFCFG